MEEQVYGDVSPRSFGEIPGLWLKIFSMSEAFFAEEAPRASGSNTIIAVVIMSVVSAIFATISTLVSSGLQLLTAPEEARAVVGGTLASNVGCSFCGGILGGIIGFYLGNGIIYLGARIFGGSGEYGTQTYLQSLFSAPISMAASLVSIVPIVGPIAAAAISIYAIVLNVRAVKVSHNLTTGKAVAAVIVPPIVVGLVVACLAVVVIVILALSGAAIGGVFEEIINTI